MYESNQRCKNHNIGDSALPTGYSHDIGSANARSLSWPIWLEDEVTV